MIFSPSFLFANEQQTHMCGLAGFISFYPWDSQRILPAMAHAIRARGPDGEGFTTLHQGGLQVALAHRRLAVLDLTPAGKQPMLSADKRLLLVFNGEIYNHIHLRRALEKDGAAPPWRGHSDSETLLACLAHWGLDNTLPRLQGMFAFACWDQTRRCLSLARDRLGEKPLYYGWQGNGAERTFLFASDLAALKAHPVFHAAISAQAVAEFVQFNQIPAPHSIYQGISKLAAGHALQLTYSQHPNPHGTTPSLCPRPWFSLPNTARAGRQNLFAGSVEDAKNELEKRLGHAVAQQMVADVPVGTFLSGGIDSSIVTALMQKLSSRAVHTFTVGFNEAGYNEAPEAQAIAKHLGCCHHELIAGAADTLALLPRLSAIYSEPFADSSQLPTFLVAQLARQHVTVALSGDGGDELFGGYRRYTFCQHLWSKLKYLPKPVRRLAATGITALSPGAWDKLLTALPYARHVGTLSGDKLHKGAGILTSQDSDDLYQRLIRHWLPHEVLSASGLAAARQEEAATHREAEESLDDFSAVSRMMIHDTLAYLPNDILCKVDRAAMAVGLETRIPLLDSELINFAWRLPETLKIRHGEGKWLLKQVLARHVPPALFMRGKTGFGIPLEHWLRGEWRDWAENLLSEKNLRDSGWWNSVLIRRRWQEHLEKRRNWQYLLWDILMFENWRQYNA